MLGVTLVCRHCCRGGPCLLLGLRPAAVTFARPCWATSGAKFEGRTRTWTQPDHVAGAGSGRDSAEFKINLHAEVHAAICQSTAGMRG
jgi:hypothetical protein